MDLYSILLTPMWIGSVVDACDNHVLTGWRQHCADYAPCAIAATMLTALVVFLMYGKNAI